MTERLTLEQEYELVQRAKTDLANFDALYRHYLPKIYRYLAFRTSNQTDAEDLTSQVFVQAIRSFGRYQWQGVRFGAWLYRIAHNALVDHYKSDRVVVLDELPDVAADIDMSASVDLKLSMERLRELLGELPEMARRIVTLRITQELSYREIADIVGSTESAIKMQSHRALLRLKTLANTRYAKT